MACCVMCVMFVQKYLTDIALDTVKQNNTINMYEDYFTSDSVDPHSTDVPSARTLAVFRDPNAKRAATKISWHPDGASKLAVSYSVMQFQKVSSSVRAAVCCCNGSGNSVQSLTAFSACAAPLLLRRFFVFSFPFPLFRRCLRICLLRHTFGM